MKWRRDRRSTPALSPGDLAATWQVASLLLEYPTPDLVCRVPLLRASVAGLPPAVGDGLAAYVETVATTDLVELQRDYVDTFDITRRCALHLTYFTCGDTRKRGVALLEFKQAYRAGGVELDGDAELPDFLPVLLEFGACHDPARGWKLLNDHRVGVELLHRALRQRQSRWLPVLESLRATLPELDGSDEEALQKLIAQGPPTEEVGIEMDPYARNPQALDPRLSAHVDPRLNPRPEPIDLGAAIPVGAPR